MRLFVLHRYFQHPPRSDQILHCLRNRVNGGMSTVVDAVHVASMLRTSHPSAFDTLTSTPVPFQYVNDGHHLHKTHYTIQLSRFPSSVTGVHDIEFINYALVNQAPLPDRKSTRLNSSHSGESRMPSSA